MVTSEMHQMTPENDEDCWAKIARQISDDSTISIDSFSGVSEADTELIKQTLSEMENMGFISSVDESTWAKA